MALHQRIWGQLSRGQPGRGRVSGMGEVVMANSLALVRGCERVARAAGPCPPHRRDLRPRRPSASCSVPPRLVAPAAALPAAATATTESAARSTPSPFGPGLRLVDSESAAIRVLAV